MLYLIYALYFPLKFYSRKEIMLNETFSSIVKFVILKAVEIINLTPWLIYFYSIFYISGGAIHHFFFREIIFDWIKTWKEEGKLETNKKGNLRLSKTLWNRERRERKGMSGLKYPTFSIESRISYYSHIRRKCSRPLFTRLKDEERDFWMGHLQAAVIKV